jgi:hypothetical protein
MFYAKYNLKQGVSNNIKAPKTAPINQQKNVESMAFGSEDNSQTDSGDWSEINSDKDLIIKEPETYLKAELDNHLNIYGTFLSIPYSHNTEMEMMREESPLIQVGKFHSNYNPSVQKNLLFSPISVF